MFESLRAIARRIFPGTTTRPSRSVFGPAAERQRAQQTSDDEWDLAVNIEKGRPRGF